MPNILIMLPETEQSVTRPAVMKIAQQVAESMRLDKNTKIYYPGTSETMQTPGTTIDSVEGTVAVFNTQRINEIVVEEDHNKEMIGASAIDTQEYAPFFLDQGTGVLIRPVYSNTTVKISFKCRWPGEAEANRWRDNIRTFRSLLKDSDLLRIAYNYIVPMEAIQLLLEVHKLREEVEPYGETFEEYVKKHTVEAVNISTDLVNKSHRLSVFERQANIIGYPEYDVIPDKVTRDESINSWTASFEYTFNFLKVIGVNLIYPISVHNQFLPDAWIDFHKQGQNDRHVALRFSASAAALYTLSAYHPDQMGRQRCPSIVLPPFDDFSSNLTWNSTGEVFSALVAVGENKRDLLYLDDLGDFMIDPEVLKFIQTEELSFITRPYQSIFCLSWYRNSALMDSEALEVLPNFLVRTRVPMSLRHQYRVKLLINMDLAELPMAALRRLRKYPKALLKVIAAMNGLLRNSPQFNKLLQTGTISDAHFSELYRILTQHGASNADAVQATSLLPGMSDSDIRSYGYNNLIQPDVMVNYIVTQRS